MDDEIARKTKGKFDCDKDFRCLGPDKNSVCRVESIIGENMFFIGNKPFFECKALHFGDAFVGKCPIRIALHRALNI